LRSKDETSIEYIDKIVNINRVAKVVKGGKRFSFSVLAVVGDGKGKVGFGLGKANEVPEAIKKATELAKKQMQEVPMIEGTVPHVNVGKFGSGNVFLKPAKKGTGIIAGGPVRAVCEAAGYQNIYTKSYGTSNPHNVVKATLKGLLSMKDPLIYAKSRGKTVTELLS
jgi:small subunit ribosomal protein S5